MACVAALGALAPAAAPGDSDPASDFLPTQNVFLPYSPRVSAPLVRDLQTITTLSAKAGYKIKVAIIASPTDLGGVPNLFNQPVQYASFLGREISFNGKQPLIVAMPVGLGTFEAGPKAAGAIADVKVGSGSDGMARAAIEAVMKLAEAAGQAPAKKGRITQRHVEDFTRELASLLAGGVPLARGLALLKRETKRYRVEAVTTGLTFPTDVTFDDSGRAYVIEAGYSYGESWTTPRLLRIAFWPVSIWGVSWSFAP